MGLSASPRRQSALTPFLIPCCVNPSKLLCLQLNAPQFSSSRDRSVRTDQPRPAASSASSPRSPVKAAAGQVSVDGRSPPFDGMPPARRKRAKKAPAPRGGGGGGGIDALPDAVLSHTLGFLPSHEAVRTSVLARRWRYLWRSAAALRIIRDHPWEKNPVPPVKSLKEFVDHLLLLRGGSALDACEISLADFDDDDVPHINLWIRHVLMSSVRVLTVLVCRDRSPDPQPWFQLQHLPPISHHLTRLKLWHVWLNDSFLDFSGCTVLEDLEIDSCYLASADAIRSPSIRRLRISSSCLLGQSFRNRICTPNLVSLRLEVGYNNRAPVLERMPSLVEAIVTMSSEIDYCYSSNSGECDYENCESCYEIEGDSSSCVVLQGLSEAKNLALISDVDVFIFRRDLKRCPTFSKLKTLLLNEYWCVPADFSALACILEHSPVLAKLTLQLFCKGSKGKIEMKGSPDPMNRSPAISEHLQIVEVQCDVVDERVLNVLKFLNALNIRSYNTGFTFEE
ncbi:hypothetical protein ACP70R_001532 [Stipagrostis hirtigluma subsp. patula]